MRRRKFTPTKPKRQQRPPPAPVPVDVCDLPRHSMACEIAMSTEILDALMDVSGPNRGPEDMLFPCYLAMLRIYHLDEPTSTLMELHADLVDHLGEIVGSLQDAGWSIGIRTPPDDGDEAEKTGPVDASNLPN